MKSINNQFAMARPKGQIKTLETSSYLAGFIDNKNFTKMKKTIYSLILGLAMFAGMGDLAKGQTTCCPPFVIINNLGYPIHGVKLITASNMGNPSTGYCDTATINAWGVPGSYSGTYSPTPTDPQFLGTAPSPNEIPARTPTVVSCSNQCITEIEWTYLGITHDLDLINGGQYGDVQDCKTPGNSKAISEAPVSAFIGYMSCPTCTGGNGTVYYDGPYGLYNYNGYCSGYSSFDPSTFTPGTPCTGSYWVQVFRIDH